MPPSATTRTTFRHELLRSLSTGIVETAGRTFLLVIAVQHFQAGAIAKSLIAAGGSMGLLLTPLVVWVVHRQLWRTARAASVLFATGCVGFLVPALLPWPWLFVPGSVIGMMAGYLAIPLLTQMYQENYPAVERGRLFSRTVMVRIGGAILFSDLGGRILEGGGDRYRILMLVFAAAQGTAAWCLYRCPSSPLQGDHAEHPLKPMRLIREDDRFRNTLISWMLMGFANLMMLPLRIEYLAHPEKYHLAFVPSAVAIAWITGVIPNIARLIMNPIWGWLFDRMNFFALRAVLNAGFAIGILAFFVSESMTGLVLGAIVYGISEAGGDVAWSLWVTKLAPADRVADYMSVHTCMTGVRGVIAPAVGFAAVGHMTLPQIGVASAILIVGGSFFLVPSMKRR